MRLSPYEFGILATLVFGAALVFMFVQEQIRRGRRADRLREAEMDLAREQQHREDMRRV